MSGLEVLAVIAAAYACGRLRQWHRNRHAIKTAESLEHIAESLRNQEKGDKE